jgi:hypothetical protein
MDMMCSKQYKRSLFFIIIGQKMDFSGVFSNSEIWGTPPPVVG